MQGFKCVFLGHSFFPWDSTVLIVFDLCKMCQPRGRLCFVHPTYFLSQRTFLTIEARSTLDGTEKRSTSSEHAATFSGRHGYGPDTG